MKKTMMLFLLGCLSLVICQYNVAASEKEEDRLPNLIYQEDFERDPSLIIGELVTHEQNTFGRSILSNPGSHSVQSVILDKETPQLEKGKKYVVSYDYKTVDPVNYNFFIIELWKNGEQNIIPSKTEGYTWVTPTTNWQHATFEFSPLETVSTARVYFSGANSTIETFDVDNLVIISNN